MSNYAINKFNTTDLTLNVMANCARSLGLDIDDDKVADTLYWICCDLESYPEDCGFGSSDSYSYVQAARKEFHMPEDMPEEQSFFGHCADMERAAQDTPNTDSFFGHCLDMERE